MGCLWVGEKRVGREKRSLEKHHISIWNSTLYIWDCLSTLGLFSVNLEMDWAQFGMVLESSGKPELCLIRLALSPGATLLWTDIQIDHFISLSVLELRRGGGKLISLKCQIAWEPLQMISWVIDKFSKVNMGKPKSAVGKDFIPGTAEISRDALSMFTLLYAVSSFFSSPPSASFWCSSSSVSLTILDLEKRTLYVAQTGIKLGILLLHSVKCWDYRCARPCLACKSFLE